MIRHKSTKSAIFIGQFAIASSKYHSVLTFSSISLQNNKEIWHSKVRYILYCYLPFVIVCRPVFLRFTDILFVSLRKNRKTTANISVILIIIEYFSKKKATINSTVMYNTNGHTLIDFLINPLTSFHTSTADVVINASFAIGSENSI